MRGEAFGSAGKCPAPNLDATLGYVHEKEIAEALGRLSGPDTENVDRVVDDLIRIPHRCRETNRPTVTGPRFRQRRRPCRASCDLAAPGAAPNLGIQWNPPAAIAVRPTTCRSAANAEVVAFEHMSCGRSNCFRLADAGAQLYWWPAKRTDSILIGQRMTPVSPPNQDRGVPRDVGVR